VDEADFDAARWYGVLQDERVTAWYTAPTALRLLKHAGDELAGRFDLSALRLVGSVGEPLNPEVVRWARRAFRCPVLDNWWQTETGGIMIGNFVACEVRPGSMGRAPSGIEAAIVERGDDGRVHPVEAPGTSGELALRAGWPSMFRSYHEPERYAGCFADGWYLSGDLAARDADGYFWFVGRADDVIKSAGHLVGPFEVESALMEHPAVAEAAVIGKPDPVLGELVKAFVALRPGFEPSDELAREIQAAARQRLGAQLAPRELAFHANLPRTRCGKIMRRLLRARELGLPEGDLSTLETIAGGVHGNEPGGWIAAEAIAQWTVTRRSLVVVPRANGLATLALERTLPGLGDLNRAYPGSATGGPMSRMARESIALARDVGADFLYDLHESWGFFNERAPGQGGTAFIGQTVASGGGFDTVGEVQRVVETVNARIAPREQISMRGGFGRNTEGATPGVAIGGTSPLSPSNYVPGLTPVLVETGQDRQSAERRAELHRMIVRTALEHRGMV